MKYANVFRSLGSIAIAVLSLGLMILVPDVIGATDVAGMVLASGVAAVPRLMNARELVHPEMGLVTMKYLRPVLPNGAHQFSEMNVHNATLRKDEWERLDDRVNRVLRQRLTVADDLRSRGLVENVSLGSVIRRTERLSDFDDAEISFDGDTKPQQDRPNFEADVIPVPVIAKDFRISWRQLVASREKGEPLDTTAATVAARKVRDKIQDLITNGISVGGPTGGGIPGLISAANRLTVDLSNNWDSASGTPVADTESMLDTAYNSNLFGPFVLYVPKNYWATTQSDYETSGGAVINRTVMERLMAFEDIQAVRPNDSLPDDEVALVQMTQDVIDLSEAQAVTTVQWSKNPFVTYFRVLFVGGPQIKNQETEDGTTVHGIVHLRAP